jgi:ribonuclease J
MVDNAKIASKLGYLDIPDSLLVPIDQALGLPNKEVVIMCTGSQGEPTSILGRLSAGTNRQFDIKPGDTVVLSSHPIPGNEESVSRTINRLFELGANVIYEAIAPVHVSGHASQEEMKLLIHLTQPKYFIPIHGELRQLKQHARLAQAVGIETENIAVCQNGQIIEFVNGKMRLGKKLPSSNIFVDGQSVGDISPEILREREALSQDGILLVKINLDSQRRILREDPEITSRGFIMSSDAQELASQVRVRIENAVSHANGNLQKDVEQAVRSFIYSETRRRPIVFVNISKS